MKKLFAGLFIGASMLVASVAMAVNTYNTTQYPTILTGLHEETAPLNANDPTATVNGTFDVTFTPVSDISWVTGSAASPVKASSMNFSINVSDVDTDSWMPGDTVTVGDPNIIAYANFDYYLKSKITDVPKDGVVPLDESWFRTDIRSIGSGTPYITNIHATGPADPNWAFRGDQNLAAALVKQNACTDTLAAVYVGCRIPAGSSYKAGKYVGGAIEVGVYPAL